MDESLSDYARRFNEKAFMVEDYIKQSIIHAMLSELCSRGFKWVMVRNTPKMLTVMIEEAQKHNMVESIVFPKENCEAKYLRRVKRERVSTSERAKEVDRPPRLPCKSEFDYYTPFNVSRKDVLN